MELKKRGYRVGAVKCDSMNLKSINQEKKLPDESQRGGYHGARIGDKIAMVKITADFRHSKRFSTDIRPISMSCLSKDSRETTFRTQRYIEWKQGNN